jgi:hypothetical protein
MACRSSLEPSIADAKPPKVTAPRLPVIFRMNDDNSEILLNIPSSQ